MDIAALSVVYHQNALKQQVGITVMKKAMDNMGVNNHALLKMMEQSVQPYIGANVDIKV